MGAVLFSSSLGRQVELTDERKKHIFQYHKDIIPFFDHMAEVLNSPDDVRRTLDDKQVVLFYRLYPDILAGKYFVAVVKINARNFILTAYLPRRVKTGEPL